MVILAISMLSNEFPPEEQLFRAIKSFPQWWDNEADRPTSAAFKDSMGCSIDRQGGRTIEECKNALLARFNDLKAIVHLSTQESNNCGAKPFYDKQDDKVYHSILKNLDGTIPITSSVAKKLSRTVAACYKKEEGNY